MIKKNKVYKILKATYKKADTHQHEIVMNKLYNLFISVLPEETETDKSMPHAQAVQNTIDLLYIKMRIRLSELFDKEYNNDKDEADINRQLNEWIKAQHNTTPATDETLNKELKDEQNKTIIPTPI